MHDILKVLSGHTHKVSSIDADQKFILSGSHDQLAKVWSIMDGTHIRDLQGHESQITCVKLNFPVAVTGARGAERCARIWNIQTAECLRILKLENNVRSLDFNPDRLVTGDDDGYLVFWDMKTCLDPSAGTDLLSYRSHNTYVVGHTSGVILIGACLLLSTSGKHGQLTIHDYWSAAAEDKDHTDSW